jgi:hypothetical protein
MAPQLFGMQAAMSMEKNLDKYIKESLPPLLSQFSKAFQQANQVNPIKPVFYFAE